jgi:hypothetical protein
MLVISAREARPLEQSKYTRGPDAECKKYNRESIARRPRRMIKGSRLQGPAAPAGTSRRRAAAVARTPYRSRPSTGDATNAIDQIRRRQRRQ